jgi:NAD(P) transhydrogenase subunit alpha
MLTTAAGTIRPAQVLVIGAGVAGLQAIATARRLGAVVEAYDVRSATREQVKSLGAKFVDTGVSAEGTGGYARELTPEEKAQQQEVLDSRIAAADAVIEHQGVKIVGALNLPAALAYNASEMYARNLYNFLKPALVKGELAIDWTDEVFAKSCLTSGGQIKHEPTAKALEGRS